MHDQRPVGLTPKTAARVIGAARSEERFDRLRYNGSGPAPFRSLPRQRVGWPVRVTGPISGGTPDLYPGVVLEFDGYLDGAAVWADGVECWVTRLPGAAAELADESEHLGEPVGEHEDKVIFAVGGGSGSAVNTQNTDGTEIDATTTDLRFDKTTGSKVTQAGGVSTHTLLAASRTQQGAVSTGSQGFNGTKSTVPVDQSGILRFAWTVTSGSTSGMIEEPFGLAAADLGGMYFDDSGNRIGVGQMANFPVGEMPNGGTTQFPAKVAAAVTFHPALGSDQACVIAGDPRVLTLRYINEGFPVFHPNAFAVWDPNGVRNGTGSYVESPGVRVGMNYWVQVGDLLLKFHGGILYSATWTGESPPPPPLLPPPPVAPPPPPPLPPSPPFTATISGTVYESGSGDPIVGRGVVRWPPSGSPVTVTTDGSGNYSFSGVSGPSYQTVIVDDNGLSGAHSVDGGAWTYGAAAGVPVTTAAHDCDFVVGATGGAAVNVTVQNAVGSTPLSGRTVTVGAEVRTTNGSGQASFAGVTPGSTNVVLTLGGSDTASWAVDTPGASGKGNTATFTSTSGGTHGVTFQVSVAPSPGPGGGE